MSVHIPGASPSSARTRRAARLYDQDREAAFVVDMRRRYARPERPGHDELAHELGRWVAIGALALFTIVFLLIVLQ